MSFLSEINKGYKKKKATSKYEANTNTRTYAHICEQHPTPFFLEYIHAFIHSSIHSSHLFWYENQP